MEDGVRQGSVHHPVPAIHEEDAVVKLDEALAVQVDRLALIFQLRELQEPGEIYAIDSLQAAYSLS